MSNIIELYPGAADLERIADEYWLEVVEENRRALRDVEVALEEMLDVDWEVLRESAGDISRISDLVADLIGKIINRSNE